MSVCLVREWGNTPTLPQALNVWISQPIYQFGSGALPGKLLNLGLLEISWMGIFPISSPCGELLPCGANLKVT